MLAEVNLSNAEQVNLEEFEAMWKTKPAATYVSEFRKMNIKSFHLSLYISK